MQQQPESSPIPTVPKIHVDVYVTNDSNTEKLKVTYDPPLTPNGYQFPKGSRDGKICFHMKTPSFCFTEYTYTPLPPGVSAKPGMTPPQGKRFEPIETLCIDFVFEGIQNGKVKLRIDGKHVDFPDDPQVGNDGETR